jgi:hypothetical protein
MRRDIEWSTVTFVLLPSLDLETCDLEIVRRQLGRSFSRRSAAREEAVIRERFGTYLSIPVPRTAAMRPRTESECAHLGARVKSETDVVHSPFTECI